MIFGMLDVGGDLDHDPHSEFLECGSRSGPEILKGFFIYYCDSYRQPRIKHENQWHGFELSECFLYSLFIYSFVYPGKVKAVYSPRPSMLYPLALNIFITTTFITNSNFHVRTNVVSFWRDSVLRSSTSHLTRPTAKYKITTRLAWTESYIQFKMGDYINRKSLERTSVRSLRRFH